jgi:nitroreductase
VPKSLPSIPVHVDRILDAAHLAPSHDNLQPWRFAVEGETISFFVDHERDRSPANARGRVARVAVGAALECALLRAGRMGATVKFLPARPGALVTFSASSPRHTPEPDKALVRRATNRRLYDGRPLDDATFAWLQQATPVLESARTLWFGRERVRTLGPIVAEGEALFYRDPAAREAALRAIRFDVRDQEEVPQGLSLGSLELTTAERLAVDALRKTPQDRLEALGAFEKMGGYAKRLVESASGVCIVTTPGTDDLSDVVVGRAMMRAWLALTRKGLVAQPMNAIPWLEARLGLEEKDAPLPAEKERVEAVVAKLRGAFPSVDKASRIGVLLRVGQAPPPSTRVRRITLGESVAVVKPEPPDGAPAPPPASPPPAPGATGA